MSELKAINSFLNEFWKFAKSTYDFQEDEKWWEENFKAAEKICEKYRITFCTKVMNEWFWDLERRRREQLNGE